MLLPLKPLPLTLMAPRFNVALPLFKSVTLRLPVAPMVTAPKSVLAGLRLTAAAGVAAPLPPSVITALPLLALLAMVRLALRLPSN